MKNKTTRTFKYMLFLRTIISIVIGICIFAILVALIDGLFNDLLADLVSGMDRDTYFFFINHKSETILGVFVLIVLISFFVTIAKTTRYIDILVNSIDKVFQRDEDLIKLPSDFGEIETKLNSIKFDALRNEQIAKEAEQRKNDLVVYLAHDLKTPLTSVIGYLTLLHDEQGISPELREKYLGISLDKAERLESLINEFFEITRFNLQNIELENARIHLTHMLTQLADEFYPLLTPKDLELNMQIEPDLFVRGDADKLARVFDNILRNAINYSYENTAISFSAQALPGGVSVRCVNQGDPIPEQKLSSIFEKFYRVDTARTSRTGGAGLGLAIAKEIVELHGGTITAKSSEEFTEFLIYLPYQHTGGRTGPLRTVEEA